MKNRETTNLPRPSDLLMRWLNEEISSGKFAELLGVPRHIGDEILHEVWRKQDALKLAKYLMDNCGTFQWKHGIKPLWNYANISEAIDESLKSKPPPK